MAQRPPRNESRGDSRGSGNEEFCFRWNFNPTGCPNPQSCGYKHVCIQCSFTQHKGKSCSGSANAEKSEKWTDSLEQSSLEENVLSAPFAHPTSTNFSISPVWGLPFTFPRLGQGTSFYDPDGIFFLDRLRFGFKLIPESDPSCIVAYESDNYSSATCPDFKPEMDSLFTKELTLGRISMVLTKPRCVHPIGRVPKKDSGKSRPITDCSRPHGISLNDHIKRDLQSFCMNSIDSAVSFSTPYCFYSIVVMESAWRWIPVSSPPPPSLTENYKVFAGVWHTRLFPV